MTSTLDVTELVRANQAFRQTVEALQKIDDFDDFVPAVLEIVARTLDGGACGMFERIDRVNYLRYWFMSGTVYRPHRLLALDPEKWGLVQLLTEGFEVDPPYLGGANLDSRSRASIVDHLAGTSRPDFDAFANALGWEIEINAPIKVGGRVLGAMTVNRNKERPFSPAEVTLAETLCAQLGLAIEASRLAHRARERAFEAATMMEHERSARA